MENKKSKEQILAHLVKNGYNNIASHKIVGFLLGLGIIEKGEIINFRKVMEGDSPKAFDHFYKWYITDECPLCGLLEFLSTLHEQKVINKEKEEAQKILKYIAFLIDSFNLESDEEIILNCPKKSNE